MLLERESIMPNHDVYSYGNNRYLLFPNGQERWAMSLDPQRLSRRVKPNDVQSYTQDGTVITEQQFIQLAATRQQQATTQRTGYFQQTNGFIRMPQKYVVLVLEAEYISALAAQEANPQDGALSTKTNTARDKLFFFLKRIEWAYERFTQQDNSFYHYSLEDNFVGETAHIRACAALYNVQRANVRYRCTTQNPGQRFTAFMDGVATHNAPDSDAKTLINETLVAPRTIENPTAIHQQIYQSFVAALTPQRKQELVQWTRARFQPHAAGQNVNRIGVWVRHVAAQGGHTVDQNMSRDRFERILEAAAAAGVDEVIVLGDGWPAGPSWLANTQYANNAAYLDFVKLWGDPNNPNQGMPNLAHSVPLCSVAMPNRPWSIRPSTETRTPIPT
jgi:hypothetical protein